MGLILVRDKPPFSDLFGLRCYLYFASLTRLMRMRRGFDVQSHGPDLILYTLARALIGVWRRWDGEKPFFI